MRDFDHGGKIELFDRPRFLPAFTAVFYVFLFAPIALVVLFSFNDSNVLAFPLDAHDVTQVVSPTVQDTRTEEDFVRQVGALSRGNA